MYKSLKHGVNSLIEKSKREYYQGLVNDNSNNSKKLYKVVNTLLNKTNEQHLPSHDSAEEVANRFGNYFHDKIVKIREDLSTLRESVTHEEPPTEPVQCRLTEFEPASEKEVKKIIMDTASKSCMLDPMPTSLLKDCLDALLPFITKIVNISLSTNIMPVNLKEAIITPLLKKLKLDPELLKNFRPISNLTYISKLIERVVAARFNTHMKENNLHEIMQSAYRSGHSTETALLKVKDDILQAIDNHQCVLLILLDLSAAFDTVDHEVLLTRLEERVGISGNALAWIQSYLTNRKQAVNINGATSKSQELTYSVPQGSVLGPLFFICYTLPLGDICRRHGVSYHLYADDTQLYLTFEPMVSMSAEAAKSRIEACILEIKCWMAHNFLKLNEDKTEFILLGTNHQLKHTNFPDMNIQIGESTINPTDMVRNIGAMFDSTLRMEKHIDMVCRSANFQLRNLGKIRKYLDKRTTAMVVHAFITSRLDNLNSLLYGIPSKQMDRLQSIQNKAARLITRTRKYQHITPVLRELHWLPVSYRVMFKILLLTYKTLHDQGPLYLKELLVPYKPSRSLRSQDQLLLLKPQTRLKTYGDCSFSYAAPLLWNKLPITVRQSLTVTVFKKKLKTHLFSTAFL